MKRKLQIIILLFTVLNIGCANAQKLEKIKGSKIVTISEVILDSLKSVSSIELSKNINLVIKNGSTDKLVINADDNLHEVLSVDVKDGKLSLSLLKKIFGKKAFDLTLYIGDLREITLNENSTLTNTSFFKTDSINITLNHRSKLLSSIDASLINFQGNDKSKSTSNFKAQNINYTLKERAIVTNTSNSEITKLNVQGKTVITLSGKSSKTHIKASQTSTVKTIGLISLDTEIIADDKSSIYTNSLEKLSLTARGWSKVYIYGKAVINLVEFKGESVLFKKQFE